jgi:hypothetical protein
MLYGVNFFAPLGVAGRFLSPCKDAIYRVFNQ